jgi:hypothetical protein
VPSYVLCPLIAAPPALTPEQKAAFAKKVDLLSELATLGETGKDPLLLIAAVQMLNQLPFGGIERPKPQADAQPGPKPEAGAKAAPAVYDRDTLLNLVKECAAEDTELLAVITKLQEAPEPTEVRGRRHRRHGHRRYSDRRYHSHRYECDWIRVCDRHGCDWVCDVPRYRERVIIERRRRRR